MNKRDKAFSVVGKIVVGIVVLIIAFPWIYSEIGHIDFIGPVGNSYVMKINNDDVFYSSYMVISFQEDETISVYRFEEDVFSRISGIKIKYKYSGKSFLHIGPLFINSQPSLLFWNNYEFHNKYTVDKAIVNTLPIEIESVNVSELGSINYDEVNTSSISIRTKSIKMDDSEFSLIEKNDYTILSAIRRFDKESKIEWRKNNESI